MKTEPIFKFNYGLSPRKPFHLGLIISSCSSSLPTLLDIHKAIHLGILRSGSMRSITRGEIFAVKQGDAYLVGPWEPHGILRRSSTEILLLTISEEELLRCFFNGGNRVRNLLLSPPGQRQKLLNTPALKSLLTGFETRIMELMQTNDEWTPLRQWHCICGFFIELDSLLGSVEPPDERRRLHKALELLHQNYGSVVKLETAAKVCGLGQSRFNHLFKEYYGIPFGHYELQYRLNCAAESLLYRSQTLKETAERWGFFDAAHFSRYFKKYFGQTPGQYQTLAWTSDKT